MDSNDKTEQGRWRLRLHGHDGEFRDERVRLRPTGLGSDELVEDQTGDQEIPSYRRHRSASVSDG